MEQNYQKRQISVGSLVRLGARLSSGELREGGYCNCKGNLNFAKSVSISADEIVLIVNTVWGWNYIQAVVLVNDALMMIPLMYLEAL